MKKFKFVGEPGEKLHAEDIVHVAFGLDFSGGKAAEVTGEKVIAKLEGNSHYEEVKARAKTPEQIAAEKAAKEKKKADAKAQKEAAKAQK